MKKKKYIRPEAEVCQMMGTQMLALSSCLHVSEKDAEESDETLSNKNVWSGQLW